MKQKTPEEGDRSASARANPALPEINEARLVGRLTNAPRVTNHGQGKDRAQFSLAVPRPNQKAGEKPNYITVVGWGAIAKQCEELAKGDGARVEGRINTWDDREKKRFLWGITANAIHVLDRASRDGNAAPKQEELASV